MEKYSKGFFKYFSKYMQLNILSIGTDCTVLDKNSNLSSRIQSYAKLVNKYTVVVNYISKKKIVLDEKIDVWGSGGKNKIYQFFNIYKISKHILSVNKYNVITVQDPFFTGLLGVLLSRKYNIKLEIQIHGWNKVNFFRSLLRIWTINHADGIRVVSSRMKKKILDLGIIEKKIIVVPIHTEINVKKDISSKKFIEKRRFITVSRLVPVKNILLQLNALAKISDKLQWELYIIGEGDQREILEKKVANLGIKSKVFFKGWLDGKNLEKEYLNSDCLLLTSNSEGWGRVVIEAGGYGIPTIMTDVGLAGEVIKNKKNGIIIPVNDVDALKDSIEKIIVDSKYLKKLSSSILKTVKKMPKKDDVLLKYVEGWKKINI